MDWIERLNEAVNYMEEHMCDTIDLQKVAKIAGCSTYHFQRMFSYLAEVPLSEYIRRRRMTLAAVDLQTSNAKIIDIALKYGYDSPTAFNRAFRTIHGIAPSQAKIQGVLLKSFAPISFKLTIKGDTEMTYRIEEKEAFWITGISMPLEHELEKNFAAVPKMWQEAASNGTIQKLAARMDGVPKGVLGVSVANDTEEWSYYIAVASNKPVEEPFTKYQIPAATWAIFSGEGSGLSIQELEKKIVTEWLPTSGYEYANAPDVEVYLDPNPKNTKYEVWIPVVKKENQ